MGLFEQRDQLPWRVPVWFMRQAGRYHDHYQNLKRSHSFMQLCKTPELARQVTLGPIEDFDFDAAILFSDLLFPLEQLGFGLEYSPGPKLERLLEQDNVATLKASAPAREFYRFQGEAIRLVRESLPPSKSLLGFVGAPFTLYTYATEGTHGGALARAKRGLYTGLFQQFLDILLPELEQNMVVQAEAGADALCLFDTAAGELALKDFKHYLLPSMRQTTQKFKRQFPRVKIIYYSRQTSLDYLLAIEDRHIDALGFDWRVDLDTAFHHLSRDYYLQGNFDPCWAHLPWEHCRYNLSELFRQVDERYWDRWIFGLGHGVLVHTPQDNVRKIVQYAHRYFQHTV